MKHLRTFESKDNIIEYLKICFIDFIDEYGYSDDDYGNDDDRFIIQNSRDVYVLASPCFDFTDDFNGLIDYKNTLIKFTDYIQDGLSKFGIRYNFDNSIKIDEYIEIKLTNIEKK